MSPKEIAPHGTERAGDPRGSRRDRQRGDRPRATASVELDKSFTDDLDIDSLSMMTIVVNAEEKFGVRIPDDEVKNLKTVRRRRRLHREAAQG
jgi:acyl carrier protein